MQWFFVNQNESKTYARSTAPDFKQVVQTCSLFGVPLTVHFTFFIFAFQT